jgi:AraC-like DNA-binding protein
VEAGQIADSPYLVKFQLRGESIWRQRGREVHLRPGDFVIASQAEPYQLTFPGDYEMPVLAVGVSTMRHLVPDPQRFLGVRMSGEDADCGLLSGFVAQVAARMDRLQEPFVSRVEANILDLLGGVLAARSGGVGLTAAQQRSRIQAYVDRHLHDHALGPTSIAAAFSMSTRTLHALFEHEPMSIGRYIKAARLESVRRALSDEALRRGRSLTELALDAGFYDLSHMSRSFRDQYGLSPRDYLTRD